MDIPDFGSRLLLIIKACKITQVTLSQRTGIGRSSLSQYLSGKVSPTINVLKKISEATGADLNWLILGEGSMFQKGKAPNASKGEYCSQGELRVIGTLNSKTVPKSGEMRVNHPGNFTEEEVISILSKEIDIEKVKKILDRAWERSNQDQRGWLKIELTNLLRKFFNLIKVK